MLFGPTGVGKTALIERLFPNIAEVISADAFQVYRSMNVGTAKPCKSIQESVPHHLIDILGVDMRFNVGDFCRHADKLINDIHQRSRLPVISGGTAFYIKAWLMGLPKTPPIDPVVRTNMQEQWGHSDVSDIRRYLMQVDPLSAKRIGYNDRYRLIRALEVYAQTGRPLSDFAIPKMSRTDFDILSIGLRRSREDLYHRIALRVQKMFQDGLEAEVVSLLRSGVTWDQPGMQAIGYKEWVDAFHGPHPNLKMLQETITRNTRRYAKRQMTFFSSFPAVQWVDITPNGNPENAVIKILQDSNFFK